mmetsp:Transcript_56438/g.175090  ORF Transcript_56438/g.175090 Transcript_56438/m.175090 type:complete len:80 (+) Transcript_56438:488-727(+)
MFVWFCGMKSGILGRASAEIASRKGPLAHESAAKAHAVLAKSCALAAEMLRMDAAEIAARSGLSTKLRGAYDQDVFAKS